MVSLMKRDGETMANHDGGSLQYLSRAGITSRRLYADCTPTVAGPQRWRKCERWTEKRPCCCLHSPMACVLLTVRTMLTCMHRENLKRCRSRRGFKFVDSKI